MTSDNNKTKDSSKNKGIKEIEIENKDLLNVFFDKTSSQFESQLFLSRKRMLSAENGQTELSELLKSKLKALDMMLFILSNNKNILKESDLSCCEVLNNLLCISKKDKSYGEHIYSKIKSIILYILKNQLFLKEKNNESNKVIIKFIITLLNIKFDNGYFKQILETMSTNEEISSFFINELFDKLFKGRNINIKIKEMKFIIKSLLFDEKIQKFMKFFDIFEKLLTYAHEKQSGGCRTSFQLNQVIFLLQYLIDILNIKEIKNSLPGKEELNKKLLKILNDLKVSIKELIDGKEIENNKDKTNKKESDIDNEIIKRKKYFIEMNNLLNKIKIFFKEEIKAKEFSQIFGEINNLYKNIINEKYNIVINANNNLNKKEKKNKKNKENKEEENNNEEEINEKENKKEENNKEIENEEEENNSDNLKKEIKLDEEEENEEEEKEEEEKEEKEKEEEKEKDEKKINKKDKTKNKENNKNNIKKNNIKEDKNLKNKQKKKKIH